MELERGNLISPTPEAPVIEGDMVTAIRELTSRGWGAKTIARELGIAKNTVRRYRRHPVVAGQQVRSPRRLTEDVVREAQALYSGVAEHNAVVVHQLLRAEGRAIGLRTVQRAVAPMRQAQRAADVATVRVETAPGAQMQVDFGEKRVTIAGTAITVFLLVAVLVGLENHRTEHGGQRQGHQAGENNGYGHRDAELAVELAHRPGDERHWNEDRCHHQGDGDDRATDLMQHHRGRTVG